MRSKPSRAPRAEDGGECSNRLLTYTRPALAGSAMSIFLFQHSAAAPSHAIPPATHALTPKRYCQATSALLQGIGLLDTVIRRHSIIPSCSPPVSSWFCLRTLLHARNPTTTGHVFISATCRFRASHAGKNVVQAELPSAGFVCATAQRCIVPLANPGEEPRVSLRHPVEPLRVARMRGQVFEPYPQTRMPWPWQVHSIRVASPAVAYTVATVAFDMQPPATCAALIGGRRRSQTLQRTLYSCAALQNHRLMP